MFLHFLKFTLFKSLEKFRLELAHRLLLDIIQRPFADSTVFRRYLRKRVISSSNVESTHSDDTTDVLGGPASNLHWKKSYAANRTRQISKKTPQLTKKQPQDSNQEAPGSGSSRSPRRLRRAYFKKVPGRSARPQFVATTDVHMHVRVGALMVLVSVG
jgi:hypothetical protein